MTDVSVMHGTSVTDGSVTDDRSVTDALWLEAAPFLGCDGCDGCDGFSATLHDGL